MITEKITEKRFKSHKAADKFFSHFLRNSVSYYQKTDIKKEIDRVKKSPDNWFERTQVNK